MTGEPMSTVGRGLVVVIAAVQPTSAGVIAAVTGQPTDCPQLVLTPVLELASGRVRYAGEWQLTDVRTGLMVGCSEPDPSWLLEVAQHLRHEGSYGYFGPAANAGGAA